MGLFCICTVKPTWEVVQRQLFVNLMPLCFFFRVIDNKTDVYKNFLSKYMYVLNHRVSTVIYP